MFFDPLYFMMIAPALVLSVWASFRVKSQFNKYSNVRTSTGMSGAEAAVKILHASGLSNIRVERADGFLSDHYDPTGKVLRLSSDVYDGRSIASVGVAAHEAGHAIQDKVHYSMLSLRTALVPTANIGSNMSWFILMAGFFMQMQGLIIAGIVLFSAVVLFQLVTLPVEFDASARAKSILWESGIITQKAERDGVASVLNAAAMTYVAAAVSAVVTLLYYLIRSGLLGGRSDD